LFLIYFRIFINFQLKHALFFLMCGFYRF
jgi:hypothetical protein